MRLSLAELRRLTRLATLDAPALARHTARWTPARLYETARRALILSQAEDLPIVLPRGVHADELPSYPILSMGEELLRVLLERTPRRERRKLVHSLELLPEDLLVDGRFDVSGAGLMKSLPLQILDAFIDTLLDLEAQEVSDALGAKRRRHGKEEVFWGFPAAMLMTSYIDVQSALRAANLPEGASIVDVGTGFGRPGLAVALLRPDLRFTGFEIVPERVAEAQRVAARNGFHELKFVVQNLAAKRFHLPAADAYFFYDPVSGPTRHKLLDDLAGIAESRRFVVLAIEGNGKLLPELRARSFLHEVRTRLPMKTTVFATRRRSSLARAPAAP